MHRGRARADPVSCQSCRSKKLKCDRVQPCSNCAARGITCQFLVPPTKQPARASTIHNIPEILGRIERLESIILQRPPTETHSNHGSDGTHGTWASGLRSGSEGVVVSDIHQRRDQDSQALENIGTREDSLLPRLSHGLTFIIRSAHEVLGAQPSASGDTVIFPPYRAALLLLQSYESNLDYMCRILHLETIRSLIKTIYLRINQGESAPPGQAALLLSIFALSAFFYEPFENSEVATTEQDAVHFSNVMSKGALDVLDYSRRNTSGTLEDVQAYILMSFVTFHLDGFSARGRILSTTAASLARDLRLHRLDAADEYPPENEPNVRVLIDREVKRRVFWSIASTDWLHATISGPQEGMYFIHPKHVNVKLPQDYLDDAIVLGEGNESVIGPPPNGMSFFLERVRLAHVCREVADIVPLETSKLLQMPYENIITLDERLKDFLSSLPFFFKLDAASRERSKPLEIMYPQIPIMRYSITNAAHSRRCKLHQRFLLRQSCDPRYSYSRQACLESARAVIYGYEDSPGYCSPSFVTARMGMAMHYTHLALVILVMDLCFNKNEADEVDIEEEVKTALQKFEDDKHISPLSNRFLSSLCDILQKHNVYLPDRPTSTINNTSGAYEPRPGTGGLSDDDQMQSTQLGEDILDPGVVLDTSFDEFWKFAVQSEPNLDSFTWDNLFSSLDSRPL
ncbi:hypothetical protein F4677DRAFT_435290 [Hypoxylon crocopeplum]|nr:hypothetical protein F4677DRAFT_435290 [Hypoxylon crocopeplum]